MVLGLDRVTGPLSRLGAQVGAAVGLRTAPERDVWADGAHAFIEAPSLDRDPEASGRMARALDRLDGVRWAEVNAITRRVVVGFDGAPGLLEQVVGVVEDVERRAAPRTDAACRPPEPCPELPWDPAPLRRGVTELAGDVVALGASGAARVLRATPLPIEAVSLVSVVEAHPRLRAAVARVAGPQAAELGLALVNAVAQGVAQGPAGIVVDAAHRWLSIGEIRARRDAWLRQEPLLYANPRRKPVEMPSVPPRPVPIPTGPVATWADRLSLAGLVGFALTLAATRNPQRAADAFLAAVPKAARLGREGFATALGQALAARGVIPLDRGALRRLDRVDTVVVDSEAVTTGTWRVERVSVTADVPHDAAVERVAALFAADAPRAVQADGDWTLGPLSDLDAELPRGARQEARRLGGGGAKVLGLVLDGRVVALARAVADLCPGVDRLVASVRRAGHRLVVAGTRGAVARQLGADGTCARGQRLGPAVQDLQRDGAVVAVVARRGRAGLLASDVGISIARRSGRPAWGADLLCGPAADGFADAALVVDACAVAREVSMRSGWLAAAGSVVGAAAAFAGPPHTAGQRCLAAVNGAAAVALVAGARAGSSAGRAGVDPGDRGAVDPDAVARETGESRRPLQLVGATAAS